MLTKQIIRTAILCKDIVRNFCLHDDLVYVVESADWAIMADGRGIVNNLKGLLKGHISTTPIGASHKILHFGSFNTMIDRSGFKYYSKNNRIVLTWYHVVPDDPRINFISESNKRVDVFHTSCNLTASRLAELGLEKKKIKLIPLGIDLEMFKQFD